MKLKIWHKMIIGISIPSFIVLLGTLLTYGYINDIKKRQSYVLIADDLKEHALEVRRNERNFLHYKNTKYFNDLYNAISILTNTIKGIEPKTHKEIGEEKFSMLNESIQIYLKYINKLFQNYQQEDTITELIRVDGRKLETSATKKGKYQGELSTSFILNLRRLEKNYMLFRDENSFTKLEYGLSQLEKISPLCTECISYVKAVGSLFEYYKKSNSLAYDLRLAGINLEKVTTEIANRERERINSFITQTMRLLLIVLVLICTLGPLFVYKTADYLATPIKRLVKITRKISEGDLNLRAPLKEQDETYLLSVSFNTMLDNLQQTQKSLEESLQLLREKQSQLVESEKRASIGLLVSGVAHELNNPLNNISLTAETIKEELKELTQEELGEYIQDILTQSERAQHIVENLLDFARARRSTAMEKQDIVGIVEGSISLIANQLKVNNIDLNLDIPNRAFYIKGNLSKLEEIFINIIINGIQAMKDKGTLSVSVKPDNNQNNIYIIISDTGPGIPEEDIKNIFEPFFTTKAIGEGSGLGLSVSHGLIIEHKGEIEVKSKVGMGTTFIIKFPLYKEAA